MKFGGSRGLSLVPLILAACLPLKRVPNSQTWQPDPRIVAAVLYGRANAIPDQVVFDLCSIEAATGLKVEAKDVHDWLATRLYAAAENDCGRRPRSIARLWRMKSLEIRGDVAVVTAEVLYGSSHYEKIVLHRGSGDRWYLARVTLHEFVVI